MSEHAALCTKLRLHSELGQTAADAIEALERQVDLLIAVAVADAEECDRYHRERDAAVADNAALEAKAAARNALIAELQDASRADAIEALGRQYEVRGEILTAAIERAEKAERLAGFALEAITFIRAIGRSTDPFPRTLAAQSFLERHGIPITENGDE